MRVDFLRALARLLALGLCLALPLQAREAPSASQDPALELRVMRVANELRCLVCQNETIAASSADLAVDLRNQVREMLRQGKSETEVYAYMTARYGDFVLYRPPLKATTAPLWFGPFVLLGGALFGLWWMLRRRNRLPDQRFEADESEDSPASAQTRQSDSPPR